MNFQHVEFRKYRKKKCKDAHEGKKVGQKGVSKWH